MSKKWKKGGVIQWLKRTEGNSGFCYKEGLPDKNIFVYDTQTQSN